MNRVAAVWALAVVFVLAVLALAASTRTKKDEEFDTYELAALVICKNEDMVIEEWLRHYIWQGVQHFYVIDNGSTDRTKDIIASFGDDLVTYFYKPEVGKQVDHCNDVLESHIRNTTAWLIVCDVDEYIYHKTPGKTVRDYVAGLDRGAVCSVYLQGREFGSSGHDRQPSTVRTSFTWREDSGRCNPKCIVNVPLTTKLNVHTHDHVDGKETVYNPDQLQFNHYIVMSREYFRKIKMTRGDVSKKDNHRDWKYFEKRDHYEVDDHDLKNLVEAVDMTASGARQRKPVIVGMTTIPSRLEGGLPERAVRSLLQQTVRPTAIVITIPEVSAKGKPYNRAKAEALRSLEPDIVHVRFGKTKDHGPILKLFGALDHAQDNNITEGSVFVSDDDVEYAPKTLEVLLANTGTPAVGFAGRDHNLRYSEDAGKEVAFLEGYACARYDLKSVSPINLRDVYAEAIRVTPESFYVDDIVIGAWLAQLGIKPVLSRTQYKSHTHDSAGTEQLSTENVHGGDRNARVFKALSEAGAYKLPAT